MHARTGLLKISPDRVDDAVRTFNDEQLPRYKEQSGYKGFTLLADRQSGEVLGVSFWESEDDLKASDELGAQARATIAERGGSSQEPVRQVWEVVVDETA